MNLATQMSCSGQIDSTNIIYAHHEYHDPVIRSLDNWQQRSPQAFVKSFIRSLNPHSRIIDSQHPASLCSQADNPSARSIISPDRSIIMASNRQSPGVSEDQVDRIVDVFTNLLNAALRQHSILQHQYPPVQPAVTTAKPGTLLEKKKQNEKTRLQCKRRALRVTVQEVEQQSQIRVEHQSKHVVLQCTQPVPQDGSHTHCRQHCSSLNVAGIQSFNGLECVWFGTERMTCLASAYVDYDHWSGLARDRTMVF